MGCMFDNLDLDQGIFSEAARVLNYLISTRKDGLAGSAKEVVKDT